MTGNKDKVRSLFLATLMVLSVFAGTVALTGNAAAASVGSGGAQATNAAADETTTQVRIRFNGSTGSADEKFTLNTANLSSDGISVKSASSSLGNAYVNNNDTVQINGSSVTDQPIVVTLTLNTEDVSAGGSADIGIDPGASMSGGASELTTINYVSLSQTDAFAQGGSTYWAGQGLYFEDNRSSAGSSDTYQIREYDTEDDEPGSLVTEFTAQSKSQVINTGASYFETGQPYVITTETQEVLKINNSLGFAEATVGDTEGDNYTFEIQSQTLSAEWEDSSVSNTQNQDNSNELSLTSNRGSYAVEISASGLDSSELQDIFGQVGTTNNGDIRVTNVNSDDDTITLSGVNDNTDINADFGNTDANDYSFNVEAVDTSASATANVSITEQEGSLSIPQGTVSEERGDTATFSVSMDNTDDGYVTIGSDDVGYNTTLYLEDGGDGQVSVEMNTFKAGRGANGSSVSWSDDQRTLSNSTEENYVYNLTDNSSDDDDSLSVVNVSSDALENPLEAGTYDIAVAAEPSAVSGGNGYTVESEDDIGTLDLQQRGTQGIQIWTASGNSNIDEQSELLNAVNQSTQIAGGADSNVGDLAVVQLQASGIWGQVNEDNPASLYQNNGMTLTVEEANPGANQDANEIDLANNNDVVQDLYVDGANNTAYLVLDTSASNSNFEFQADEDYTASWEINSSNPMIEEDSETSQTEKETAEKDFSVVEPTVSFNNLNDNDVLQVQSSQNAQVSGTTNIAPGSSVTVRLRNSDSGQAFLKTAKATVQGNGTFSTTIDMSDIDTGTNFTAELRRGGKAIDDDVDGTVVEQVETSTPSEETETPGETETPSETTTSGETTTASETTTQSGGNGGGTTTTTTTSNTPGFGVIVALVALVAAALLAVRREN